MVRTRGAPAVDGATGTLARCDSGGHPLIDEHANRRRARALLATATLPVLVLVALVGALVLGPVPGVLLGLVAAVALGAWLWRAGPGLAERALPATPADPVAHARLHNVVAGLCAGAGVPKPRLLVVEDRAPNALAFGRGPRRSTLLVTSGLLERLDRVELEGVVARQLTGIKNHDTGPATLAVALLTVLAPVPPLSQRIRRAATTVPPVMADANGVAMTRYPPGLIAAYEQIRRDAADVRAGSPATAHLWLVPPATAADPDHPPLDERIEALREL